MLVRAAHGIAAGDEMRACEHRPPLAQVVGPIVQQQALGGVWRQALALGPAILEGRGVGELEFHSPTTVRRQKDLRCR